MRARLAFLLWMVWNPAFAFAEGGGIVKGVVLNETGTPVVQARVGATDVMRRGPAGPIITETDDDGRFTFPNLPWGQYRVFAGKQDEGYPEFPYGWYIADSDPIVSLQATSPTANVTLNLPPKAGAIQTISVIDAITGEELSSVFISQGRRGGVMTQATTATPMLVPSNTEVFVQVTRTGFKPWPANENLKNDGRIQLKPEQGMKLGVKLAPEGSAAKSIGAFSPAPYAPPRIADILDRSDSSFSQLVYSMHVTANDILVPLLEISRQYRMRMGIELAPDFPVGGAAGRVRIDIKDGSVREALDAIVAADPRYSWRGNSEIVSVFLKNHVRSLPDVWVNSYSVSNVTREEAIDSLIRMPEAQRWLERSGVHRREFVTLPGPPPLGPDAHRFSISETNAPVRTILNFILTQSGSQYWTYCRYGDNGQFFTLKIE